VLLLDMDHPLVRHLLASARHYDFEGITGATALDGPSHVVTGMLRWQDERGQRLRQEYIAVAVGGGNGASVTPNTFSYWRSDGRWGGRRGSEREYPGCAG